MTQKVYHLLSETEPFSEFRGGAISRWAANVLRAEEDAIIICPSTDDSWHFPESRVISVPRFSSYERVRRPSARLPWLLHQRIVKYVLLPSIARVGRGDILWVHNRPDYAIILAPYIHKAGAKLVLHMHNSHLLRQSSRRIQKVQIDHFIFVSKFLQKESIDRFPFITNSTVLYNGANEEMFYPPETERPHADVPKILFASRLVREKGGHIFLDAMRRLGEANIPATGIMVGASHFGGSRKTGYMAELQNMAPSNVEFRPYCSGKELADMFRESDIFCAPSIWEEPFGMVNIEAFASGLPVVSTHGGGSAEVFVEGGGILVDRGSTDQLVDALRKLIADPALRKQIAAEGQASFRKNFTWDMARARYRDIVTGLLT